MRCDNIARGVLAGGDVHGGRARMGEKRSCGAKEVNRRSHFHIDLKKTKNILPGTWSPYVPSPLAARGLAVYLEIAAAATALAVHWSRRGSGVGGFNKWRCTSMSVARI